MAVVLFAALAKLHDLRATSALLGEPVRVAIPLGALFGVFDATLVFLHASEGLYLPWILAASAVAGSFAGWRVCAYLTRPLH